MRISGVKITYDDRTGEYTAEESVSGGVCGAFGATPEEAMARLELAKALMDDCELCREERLRAERERARSAARGGRFES